MALNDTALNLMLDELASNASHAALHTSSPGTDGSNELSGTGYERQTIFWIAASGGTATTDDPIVFTVPGDRTITHIGYWSAGTAGTFYGFRELDSSQTFATSGTYTIAAGNLSEALS
jgi:hypothetical protein